MYPGHFNGRFGGFDKGTSMKDVEFLQTLHSVPRSGKRAMRYCTFMIFEQPEQLTLAS